MAPCLSQSRTISASGAASPSMPKTASVTTSFRRAPEAPRSLSSSPTSLCQYRSTSARESRQPSMMEAWFHSSEKTASPRPTSAPTTPALAW